MALYQRFQVSQKTDFLVETGFVWTGWAAFFLLQKNLVFDFLRKKSLKLDFWAKKDFFVRSGWNENVTKEMETVGFKKVLLLFLMEIGFNILDAEAYQLFLESPRSAKNVWFIFSILHLLSLQRQAFTFQRIRLLKERLHRFRLREWVAVLQQFYEETLRPIRESRTYVVSYCKLRPIFGCTFRDLHNLYEPYYPPFTPGINKEWL